MDNQVSRKQSSGGVVGQLGLLTKSPLEQVPMKRVEQHFAPARATFSQLADKAAWLLIAAPIGTAIAAQVVIGGPGGSGSFGEAVTVLPNGNIVVVDTGADAIGSIADVGAVYLYRPTGVLISTLRGSSAGDAVGNGGITVLETGNFVVSSPNWRNGAASNAGAVTFVAASSGINGAVSAANSLVGTGFGNLVGSGGVTPLVNGNYVVVSDQWEIGTAFDGGAVTLGSGTNGISGAVDVSNSLVGNLAGMRVGSGGITGLSNGNFVVSSPLWDDGVLTDVGAATFASAASGISGLVSATNSLVGSAVNDRVGLAITALSNGNYVVVSTGWDNGTAANAGAATFGSGVSGVTGLVTPTNSLVGSTLNDQVGNGGIAALSNGNYVVGSSIWSNGATVAAGAATFGSGAGGTSGVISTSNSLIGGRVSDRVGFAVVALRNGNYVVASPFWDNATIVDTGAATFGSGTSGIVGLISASNSLIGDSPGSFVGFASQPLSGSNPTITPLSNGNYVVGSGSWDRSTATDVGAMTFGSGLAGVSGIISASNSLIGSTASDRVASRGITELLNGNFVVVSDDWDNGAVANAGAVTFASGVGGINGVVTPINSLVGTSAGDAIGRFGVTVLSNGNYLVRSSLWDNGATADVGALTIGSGTTGISGAVSASNSRVGTTANDRVGSLLGASGVAALGTGNYAVASSGWNNGATADVGAVTFAAGISGSSGNVSPSNSLVGSTALDQIGTAITTLSNGNYVVVSNLWDNGAIDSAGAITLGLADGSVIGPITATHSVLGLVVAQGLSQVFDYDSQRNQLAVGQPASNRVVLQRSGVATSIGIVGDTPDPSTVNQSVTFTATVSAATAPTNGQVSFRASSGESCVDATPTTASATTANFSCTIVFTAAGTSTVIAEYTGSTAHAFSGSASEEHTATLVNIFANGFETP